jgi:hypothetical protein
MRIDPRDLQRQYESMSDEELLSLNREDLMPAAQAVYDGEIARRGLNEEWQEDVEEDEEVEGVAVQEWADGEEPDWLETAATMCSFEDRPGAGASTKAEEASVVLRTAGIPSFVTITEDESGKEPTLFSVMVPNELSMHGMSILDRDIFNEQYELGWHTHVDALSDEDLLALDPKIFLAGILDRADRARRVYDEEVTRRGLKPRR